MEFEVRGELPRGARRAFEILFSREFAQATDAELNLTRELVEEAERDGKRYSRYRLTNRDAFAAALASVVGSSRVSSSMEETLDHARLRAEWRFTLPVLVKKIRVEGTHEFLERPGDDTSEHVVRGTVDVLIPVVGKRLERAVSDQLKGSFERQNQLAREWMQRQA